MRDSSSANLKVVKLGWPKVGKWAKLTVSRKAVLRDYLLVEKRVVHSVAVLVDPKDFLLAEKMVDE